IKNLISGPYIPLRKRCSSPNKERCHAPSYCSQSPIRHRRHRRNLCANQESHRPRPDHLRRNRRPRPAALKAVLAADAVLASGSLSKRDQETVKLVISEATGCDYCVAAHSLLGKLSGLKPEELKKIRVGESTGDTKRDALVRFVRSLAK